MGEYMRAKFQLSETYDTADFRIKAIDCYTTAAWAVFDYLKATGQL
jgi:hypothetical protein